MKGRWRGLGQAGDWHLQPCSCTRCSQSGDCSSDCTDIPGTYLLNINGPDVVSWNEYIERLGDALGIPDRATPNATLFRGMAAAAGIIRMGGRLGLSAITLSAVSRKHTSRDEECTGSHEAVSAVGELRVLSRKVHYSADQAARVLGLSPSIPLEEGLRQSVAWCRVHGVF